MWIKQALSREKQLLQLLRVQVEVGLSLLADLWVGVVKLLLSVFDLSLDGCDLACLLRGEGQ